MDKTLVIGLDGATFTILDSLMKNGTMPFLKALVAKGVRAELLSTVNPLTPPAWTSIMTGRSPGNHGIIDFIWAEQREKDHYFTLYNFRDIQCETIWSIVSRNRGSVCSLNFPIMAPPPKVSGYIIPGLVSWKHLRRNTHPQEIFNELKVIPGFDPKKFAWDFNLEKKAAKGVPPEEYGEWIKFHRLRERHWFDIARHLLKKKKVDLASILFDGMDKILHIGWRLLDPQVAPDSLSPQDQNTRELCLGYFRELDRYIEDLAALAGDEANIFIVSDHGFGPAWEVFRVNTWLHEQGYLEWKDLAAKDQKTRKSIQRLVDQHFVLLDWDKTIAYARTTTSNGIYIKVAENPGQNGVPPDNYEKFMAELIAKLKTVRDPESGEPIIKKIIPREKAYPGPHNKQAPDLTLVMRDHSFISILNKKPAVCRRPEIEGTHYPEGVFIAAGPGIKQGEIGEQLTVIDVVPAVLYSLGLGIPSDLEGRVPLEVFDTTHVERFPLKIEGETVSPDSYAIQQKYSLPEDEEKTLFEQMRALGYIE